MIFTATEGAVRTDGVMLAPNAGIDHLKTAIGAAELRARVMAHQHLVQIATVKQEHGLLTAEQQDDLLLDGEQLTLDCELWRMFR